MNGDDFDPKELNTPPEILECTAVGCIEILRRKRVCFYPGPHTLPQPGEITDFGQCVPYMGNCDALIFCAPHHGKESACATVQHYLGGGDPALTFDPDECVTEFDFIPNADLIFPNRAENLLAEQLLADGAPRLSRPEDKQFWALYVILSIVGRNEKLHLMYLGLRGYHAWLYFFGPHGIKVARAIASP